MSRSSHPPYLRLRRPPLRHSHAACSRCSEVCDADPSREGGAVKQGYRLIVLDKDGVLVSEFQLTENDLAQPEAFVASIKQTIDDIEEEEP
jgi:hypothetical protein